jgi:dihydroneopterin aldolase
MMDATVELNGMKFYAYHGVSSQETKVGNCFIVDVLYSMPLQEVFSSDKIEDTISYADIYELIKQEMMISSKLLETATARIIWKLKAHFSQLLYLKVKLTKINPPLGGEVYSASVTLEERW